MITGTAGGQDESLGPAQLLRVEIESAEMGAGVGIVEPASHGVQERVGLLINLFEHVMLKFALVAVPDIPIDLVDAGFNPSLLAVEDVPVVRSKHTHLVVFQIHYALGVADQGAGVAGEKIFIL